MLTLETTIAKRVATALADGTTPPTWLVFESSSVGNRPVGKPTATVRLANCEVADSKTGAVNVLPSWAVLLVVRKSEQAAQLLDAAFADVVAALHNWPPGEASGRTWNRLALAHIVPPPFADDGLVGIELIFETHARYDGQQM